jgi:hypothetical protein
MSRCITRTGDGEVPGKSVNYRVTGAVEQGDRARVRVEVLDEPDVEELREVGRRPQEIAEPSGFGYALIIATRSAMNY